MERVPSATAYDRRSLLALAAVIALIVVAVGVTRSAPPKAEDVGAGGSARNVIYLQGDGMGAAQRQLIRLATAGRHGDLAMDRLPVAGSMRTDSADTMEAVTDSAAAGTAIATGRRTYNGGVGVDAQGRRVPTALEVAKRSGRATGLVTTAAVTDASPAAFAAHVPDRVDQSEIARQYVADSRPDVILGGGEDWWYPKGEPGAWPDRPHTDRREASHGTKGDLVERAKRTGYTHVSSRAELAETRADRVLGLFANEEMFEYRGEGRGDRYQPSVPLPVMTQRALDILSRNDQGFFLMVEEEGIDAMGHANNAELAIEAGQAFDAAVAAVLDFVKTHPRTLVIVGGDHETGGLAIENTDIGDESGSGNSAEDGPFPIPGSHLEFTVDWTTDGHTGADTPLTATGPGASRLGGTIDNVDVFDAMVAAMRG